jgi:D-glycero-D-manno-heptose 1,7-bisphosphate phosphatase
VTAQHRVTYGRKRAAVFFDRDGTLIQDVVDLRNPDDVVLVPHAANAVRYINYALIPVIVVTNQEGIGRGAVTESEYGSVKARLDDLLAERNASIEATYCCPHDPGAATPCACRKPATALFEQAISELRLDAARCAYIGDRLDDIVAARTLGGRGILVPSAATPGVEVVRAAEDLEVAATLTDAVNAILGSPPAPGPR